MGEAKKAAKAKTPQKANWLKGVKAEFRKIIWPDQNSLTRQTVAVVGTSVALALIIKILDMLMTFGIDILVTL